MDNPGGRYGAFARRVAEGVLATSGHTTTELRQAIAARAARLGGGLRLASHQPMDNGVSAGLTAYIDNVARHAYRVTDADVAALKRAGHSDDVLFEVTVAAALGAALGRLERGLATLNGAEPA
ncbi:MAG TPA: hypothetical protein VM736_06820 [Gemmatimonadales bacterium]|nr:hypothetical protein [Gemmatimonadales bacterium]